MRPKPSESEKVGQQRSFFEHRLDDMLDEKHPLFKLANKINWSGFDSKFGQLFRSKKGKPATPTRVVVGLLYIKHTFNFSDEEVVLRFKENPYWQYFCGYSFFQKTPPCDATVLVKWRKRMKEEGMEFLLQETLAIACEEKLLKPQDFEHVIVDTTVQEKNIAFPTDAKLLNRARESLVREAQKQGLKLRQTFARESKILLLKYSGYSHAKQFKRAKKPIRRLQTILGRVIREVERLVPEADGRLNRYLEIAKKIHQQKKTGKDKVYSVHEPEVECIAKGKAHKRYEFGCKVSIMTTNRSNWIVGAIALHGRPYDGHTIPAVLEQARRIMGRLPGSVYADKGYRGSSPPAGVRVYVSGQKRGVDKKRKRLLRRRSAVEPVIGHLKSGNRMGRNFLKGLDGDKHNALLAAAGRNMAKLLAAFFVSRLGWEFLQEIFSFAAALTSNCV